MKKRNFISAVVFVAVMALPAAAFAQSSEDILMEMYKALNGPSTVEIKVATSTASTTARAIPTTVAPVAPKAFSTAVPEPRDVPLLAPGYLFSVDGNAPALDPNIESLKAVLAQLTMQYSSLATGASLRASTSTATTTAPVVPPKKNFTRDLVLGSRGDEVRQLQVILIARGFLFGEATGYFGILTKTAVIAFQTDNGLPPVGNVGPRTRAVLNDMPQGPGEAAPQLIIGPPARPLTASSTSVRFNTGTSTGTSSPETGTSTPLFDSFYPPVSVSMSILPQEAPVGGSVALTWLSQNATSCTASDGWDGVRPTLGAARIEPLQFSLNFVITCQGPGGIASTSALVVVGGEQ